MYAGNRVIDSSLILRWSEFKRASGTNHFTDYMHLDCLNFRKLEIPFELIRS
jgi:hypothetical protein